MADERDGYRPISELDESTKQAARELGAQLSKAGVETLPDTDGIAPPSATPATPQPETEGQNQRFRARGMDDGPQRGGESARNNTQSPSTRGASQDETLRRRNGFIADRVSTLNKAAENATKNEQFHENDKNLGQDRKAEESKQPEGTKEGSIFDRYSRQPGREETQNREQEQEKAKDNER